MPWDDRHRMPTVSSSAQGGAGNFLRRLVGLPHSWVQGCCDERKRVSMGRLNLERLMTFADGSFLAISTTCSKEGEFSCTIYSALETDERTVYRIISNHLLLAPTCLSAQEQAYSWTLRLYPQATEFMKKPPYLIWHGPQSAGIQ